MREIKVKNWPELLDKVKSLVAQDKNWKLVEEYWAVLSTDQNKKAPRQGVKLMKIGESVDIYCEAESNFSGVDSEKVKDYLKWVEEVEKIIPRDSEKYWPQPPLLPAPPTEPTPHTLPRPIRDKNGKVISSRFAGCPNLEVVKKLIKEYYQENQAEIQKNSDFTRWIKAGETDKLAGKNKSIIVYVGNPMKYPSDLPDWQKKIHNELDFFHKSELTLSLGDGCQSTTEVEQELKNYWNSLVGKKEKTKTPQNPTNKSRKSEIEQLKEQVNELENNSLTNNSEQQKRELADKRKRLQELLSREKNNDTSPDKSNNSNLPVYLGLGGIVLLISSIFLVKLVRKRKKK